LKEILTGSHPYGFLAVPKLAEAAGVYHTNPELFYIPKQDRLGDYNAEYGNEIYMIEERPEEHWLGAEFFGSPNHDIGSTDDLYERLARDEKYSVDETQYIKTRVFDMLIGDFDRHHDQWRWAEDELETGQHVFKAIPRDRDQAFADFDSNLFNTLKFLSGFPKRYVNFESDIKHPEEFHFNALPLDRTLLRNSSREDWLKQAEIIQNTITPEVVDQAFNRLPEELQDEKTEALKTMLLKRKANLKTIVNKFYDNLTKYTLLTATDKDDYIDIESDDNQVKVTMYRNKGGDREDKYSERTFKVDKTKEIWIYALQDDDIFTYSGISNKIKIRLIGGHGDDEYKVLENGNHLRIYDHKSLKNTVTKKSKAKVKWDDDYVQNNFDKNRNISGINNFIPKIGFNPDDGFLIGATNSYTYKGFSLNPFTYRHTLSAGFYFETEGVDLDYEGEFAKVIGDYNLVVGGRFTSPNFAVNFFGFGNDSQNPEDEIDRDFNRVRYESVMGKVGFRKTTKYGSSFTHLITLESIDVERTEGRFLDIIADDLLAQDPNFFDRKTFLGAQTEFNFSSLNDALNPSKGMNFDIEVGAKLNLDDTDRAYAFVNPNLEFYNPLTPDERLVLRTQALSEINFGNQFEFYQAASAGSHNALRGYRRNRFLGQQSLIGSGDLRYSFNQFKTGVVPLQFGVFGGYDIGRVWSDVNPSDRWNDNYGGGVWFTAADLVQGTLNLFYGDDDLFFSFQVNVSL
ncbi:MAG: phosphoesterase, partial [Bacteroidetes bacterium]|nr:phosphoesterase [Bacteroidota bacterium]